MANFIISPYAISYNSIKEALQNYINDKNVSSVVDTWSDFYTAGAGETIVELDAAVAAFYAFHFIIGRREAYLPVAQNYSSIIGGAEGLGYNASRGQNVHMAIKLKSYVTQTLTKWTVIGSYGDYDIVFLGGIVRDENGKIVEITDQTPLLADEETEIAVVIGNSTAQSIVITSKEIQQFTFTAEDTTDDCRLILTDKEVPFSSELKDAVNDLYITLTNSYGSVDVFYLNNGQYKYDTQDTLYLQYIQRNSLKFNSVKEDTIDIEDFGLLLDFSMITDNIPVQDKESVRLSASIYHETNNVVRARRDYAKTLQQQNQLSLIDVNDHDVNPGVIAITYLKNDRDRLTQTEKETFMEQCVKACPDGVADVFIEDPIPVYRTLSITLWQQTGESIPTDIDSYIQDALNKYRNQLSPTLDFEQIENDLEKIPGVKVARVSLDAQEYQTETDYKMYDIVTVEDIPVPTEQGIELQTWNVLCYRIKSNSGNYEPDWSSATEPGETVIDNDIVWLNSNKYVSSVPYRWKQNDTFNLYSDVAVGYNIYPKCTSYTQPAWDKLTIIDGNVTFNRVKTYDYLLRNWAKNTRFALGEYVLFNKETKYGVYKVKELLHKTGTAVDWTTAQNINDVVYDNAVTWTMMYEGYDLEKEYSFGDEIALKKDDKIIVYEAGTTAEGNPINADTYYFYGLDDEGQAIKYKASERNPFDGTAQIYECYERTTLDEEGMEVKEWIRGNIIWTLQDENMDYSEWQASYEMPILSYVIGNNNVFKATDVSNSKTGDTLQFDGSLITEFTDNNIVWELDTYNIGSNVDYVLGTTWLPVTEYEKDEIAIVEDGEYHYIYNVAYVTESLITTNNTIYSVSAITGVTGTNVEWSYTDENENIIYYDNIKDGNILWTKTNVESETYWQPVTRMILGDVIKVDDVYYMFTSLIGTTGVNPPNWNALNGGVVEDNNIVWQKIDNNTTIKLKWNEYLELDYTLNKIQ